MGKTYFHCDRCGREISDGKARIIFFDCKEGDFKTERYQIVCHDCAGKISEMQKDASLSDFPLNGFGDSDAIMRLLEALSDNRPDTPQDKENVLLLIKRIAIPYYESNYQLISEAESQGVYTPNGKEDYPSVGQLMAIDQWRKGKSPSD